MRTLGGRPTAARGGSAAVPGCSRERRSGQHSHRGQHPHPFADGNGRTARLLEYAILARSGVVPFPAALLLSNHYNLTRDRYYRELEAADRSGTITGFVQYAVQGLVNGLREQTDESVSVRTGRLGSPRSLEPPSARSPRDPGGGLDLSVAAAAELIWSGADQTRRHRLAHASLPALAVDRWRPDAGLAAERRWSRVPSTFCILSSLRIPRPSESLSAPMSDLWNSAGLRTPH
ncbi:MAG: Fic family protein [bacterium]|nr:Fic family protein [bacterium]